MIYDSCQSMVVIFCCFKYAFALEKCLQPKKPLYADNGDGWGLLSTKFFSEFISASFFWAYDPHKMNTLPEISEIFLIIWSVKISQPISLCEFGLLSSTVNELFRSKTPWSDHFSRFPLCEMECPKSS